MPPRETKPDIVRIVEGLDGEVAIRSEIVIRFDYGLLIPWVRRIDHDDRIAIAGPDALVLRTPVDVDGENLTTVSEFTSEREIASPSFSPGSPRTSGRRSRSTPSRRYGTRRRSGARG
jgi:hypothetical protein